MNIRIHGKNVNVSTRLDDYASKRLTKLERYLPNIVEVNLELRTEKHKGKEKPIAQLTVRNARGMVFRAEDKKQEDLFAAIDVVVDKLYKQIRRYKGKTQSRKNNERWIEAANAWETMDELPTVDEELVEDYDNAPRQVLRRKVVPLTPMSEPEAIDQMELLGHDFFVFYNGEEDTINVLYRRQDGNLGILTPQLD